MRIETNGVGLEVELQAEGNPVVLLHGFPDSGRMWRHQVAALTQAGFRTVVPDQRGYGSSDKPTEVSAYSLAFLVADVVGMLDALSIERAHIVGHDWGAAVAWAVATFAPDRVDHLVAMSVGHPSAFAAAGTEQRERSSYMQLFVQEGVAEEVLMRDNWAAFRSMSGHPDIDAVILDLERDKSLTTGLNWYRANMPPGSSPEADQPPIVPDLGPVLVPTMGIWSSNDFALGEKQMIESSSFVKGPWRYERVEDAGHWPQLDRPETVNDLLLDFLAL